MKSSRMQSFVFENYPGFEAASIFSISESRADYGHHHILVEACPGDARSRPMGRSVLVFRVERKVL